MKEADKDKQSYLFSKNVDSIAGESSLFNSSTKKSGSSRRKK